MNIFLRQELDRMAKVLKVVRATLSDLKLAIEGTIIMSNSLREALDSMYDARVPESWGKVNFFVTMINLWIIKESQIWILDILGIRLHWILVH